MSIAFDLRPFVTDSDGDGQLYVSEGVTPDMYENCMYACFRDSARDLGYGVPYDAEQLRQIVAPGTHSGTNFGVILQLAKLAADKFPGLADCMSWEFPDDVPTALRNYGAQGYLCHWGGMCDSQANVPPVGTPVASHCLRSLAADDQNLYGQNPWPHPDYQMTDDVVRAMYDTGGILVFKHPIGVNMADLESRVSALENFRDAIATPNLQSVNQKIGEEIEPNLRKLNQDVGDLKAAQPVAGPQGPAGPSGPPGPTGPKGDKGDPGVAVASQTTPPATVTAPGWGDVVSLLFKRLTGKA